MKVKRVLCLILVLCMVLSLAPAVAFAEAHPAITPGVETTAVIANGGDIAYFSYTPTNTENHTFYSIGDADTYGYLYDSDMQQLTYNDDSEDRNFSITWELEAGKTYILGVRYYNSSATGSIPVMLRVDHESSEEAVISKPATCTEDGILEKTCDTCGEIYREAIPATGHTWSDEPDAETGYVCLRCGEQLYVTGTCGENVAWELDHTGTLTISGTGDMADYRAVDRPPWIVHSRKISRVIINEGVTAIGSYAFAHCLNLVSVILPESITSIGNSAFGECWSLTGVSIPADVVSISTDSFSGCRSLNQIAVAEDNQYYSSDNQGALYNKAKNTLITAPGAASTFVIPESVTSVGDFAFYRCINLKNVTIAESVTSIGESSFFECCELTRVTIPEGTTHIGEHAFDSCIGLVECSIPKSVVSIGTAAFVSCESLPKFDVAEDNQYYSSDDQGALYNKVKTTLIVVPGAVESFAIPESVSNIENSAFSGCISLTDIVVPEGIASIEAWTFSRCFSLTRITLPSSLESIGDYAFSYCHGLTEIVIPKGVDVIGECAFISCSNLNTVIFEGDIPTIVADMFSDVTATAYYPAGNETWTEEVLQDYGGTITWVARYETLEGDNTVVEQGDAPQLQIRAAGEIEKFESVTVDGETVDPSHYTVTEGSTIITFEPAYLKMLEEGDHTVVIHFDDGVSLAEVSVEKPSYILGDVNSDGRVNNQDRMILTRYLAKWSDYPESVVNMLAADVNCDGKVNNQDRMILTRHLAQWSGYETMGA